MQSTGFVLLCPSPALPKEAIMNKHLTLDDRMEIQMGLKAGESFTAIARRIDSDRTTVGREVKARRIPVHNSKGNNCIHRKECQFPDACSHYTPGYRYGCHKGRG